MAKHTSVTAAKKAPTRRRRKGTNAEPERPFAQRKSARLVTAREAAEILAVKPRMITRLVSDGQLPVVKSNGRDGGLNRFDIRDIEDYIKRNKRVRGS
jgi:excisionase family DNA binding protein